jgi:hypothetical protein
VRQVFASSAMVDTLLLGLAHCSGSRLQKATNPEGGAVAGPDGMEVLARITSEYGLYDTLGAIDAVSGRASRTGPGLWHAVRRSAANTIAAPRNLLIARTLEMRAQTRDRDLRPA